MKQKTLLAILIAVLLSLVASAGPRPCKATTKKGEPCKAWALKGSDYCRSHNPNAAHCLAPTKSGGQCQVVVKKAGEKCRLHS